MLTDKTNNRLYKILYTLGLILLFGGFIWEVLSDIFHVLPVNDIDRSIMILGIPIALISMYFKPITEDKDNYGCIWGFMISWAILWILDIKHYTTPIIIINAISVVLMVPGIILSYKKWKRIKALQDGDVEKEENNEKQE
jgi:hypothetical protein